MPRAVMIPATAWASPLCWPLSPTVLLVSLLSLRLLREMFQDRERGEGSSEYVIYRPLPFLNEQCSLHPFITEA